VGGKGGMYDGEANLPAYLASCLPPPTLREDGRRSDLLCEGDRGKGRLLQKPAYLPYPAPCLATFRKPNLPTYLSET